MRIMATICAILAAGTQLQAQPASDTNPFQARLKTVPVPELPLLAAFLVKQAKPEDRPATATNIAKAVVRIAPTASLAVVGEMSRSSPEIAPVVVCALANEQSSLVPDFCRAAVAAAPAHTRDILIAVCRAVPKEYRSIALAAVEGAPSSGSAILQAVATVRPELTPYLELEVRNVGSTPASVSRCLDRAERAQKRANLEAEAAGTARPEAKPLAQPSDHTDQKPPKGGWGPPGGRNYAKP